MASRIPEPFKQELLARVDLVELVRETVDLRRSGSSHKGACPFHEDSSPSFYVSNLRGTFHCFGCGAKGDAIAFLMKSSAIGFVDAVRMLAERHGLQVPTEELDPLEARRLDEARSERARLLDLLKTVQEFFRSRFDLPQGAAARDYARQRGLTQETIMRYGLGAAGEGWDDLTQHCRRKGWRDEDLVHVGVSRPSSRGSLIDEFRQRLMLPVYNHQGELVAFVGRDLSGREGAPKYTNTKEVRVGSLAADHRHAYLYKKGNLLFGLTQARAAIQSRGEVLVVEGNLDALMVAQAGHPNVVCVGTSELTANQIAALGHLKARVVLVLDGDDAGRRGTRKMLSPFLMAGLDGRVVTLAKPGQPKTDPDSFVREHGAEAFGELVRGAPSLINAYIDSVMQDWDRTETGAGIVLKAVQPVLAAVTARDPITADLALNQLIVRLDVRGRSLDEGRKVYSKYLSPAALGVAARPAPPAAAPTPHQLQSPPPLREYELLEILAWYPVFLAEAERKGVLDALEDERVQVALRALCDVGRHGLDLDGVARWARETADNPREERARTLVSASLQGDCPVAAHHAQGAFVERAGRVMLAAKRKEIDDIAADLRGTPPHSPQYAELAEQLQQAQAERRAYEQALRQVGQPRGAATGGAAKAAAAGRR